MRKFWDKFKWHVFVGVAIVLFIVVYIFGVQDKFSKDLNKWLFKKKADIVKAQIERIKVKEKDTKEEIKEIDKKIKEIDKKIKEDNREIEEYDLKELNDAWKTLGY